MEAGEQKPKRARGQGRIWQVGRIWWVQYYVHGRQIRESSKSEKQVIAQKLLDRRLLEARSGQNPGPKYERVKYEEMRDAYYASCKSNGFRSLNIGKDGKPYFVTVNCLNRYFKGYRAVNITTDVLRKYREKRLSQEVKDSTINREVSSLRAMFNLAVKDGRVRQSDVPAYFPIVKERNARKGFFEKAEYLKLRDALPEELRPILTIGYFTGMRLGEIINLRWSNVDFLGAMLRLDPYTTKNEQARNVPLNGELLEALTAQFLKRLPDAEFIFIRKSGERIQSFYKAWKAACDATGLTGKLFHDLRRTGVRNLVRAGVPQSVAMDISGHKTISVFKRYNITSDADLKEAAAKLEKYIAEQKAETYPEISPDRNQSTQTVANA